LTEVAVTSDQVDKVIEAISGAAKTSQTGDGKIFAFGLEQAERICSWEVGNDAL
jgi:nitrogen regulatory protein P-II 2